MENKIKSNICLYGPPGSGKSSVSFYIGHKLKMEVYDVDDDHLEKDWNMSVAEKLELLGDEKFLEAEEESTIKINKINTILSLTGSNPLSEKTMVHLKKSGVIVYIDVDKQEILKRCHQMKIDRVVGMSSKTFDQILDFRKEIYEKYYDYRIIVGNNETPEQIADKVIEVITRDEKFLNLRNLNGDLFFEDVLNLFSKINQGDSSVNNIQFNMNYFPKFLPTFSFSQFERLAQMNINQRIGRILENFPLGFDKYNSSITPQIIYKLLNQSTYVNLNVDLEYFFSNLCSYLLLEGEYKSYSNLNNLILIIIKSLSNLNLYLDLIKNSKIEFGQPVDEFFNLDLIKANSYFLCDFFDDYLNNIISLLLAKKMGVPINKIIIHQEVICDNINSNDMLNEIFINWLNIIINEGILDLNDPFIQKLKEIVVIDLNLNIKNYENISTNFEIILYLLLNGDINKVKYYSDEITSKGKLIFENDIVKIIRETFKLKI